ncbi:MAG: hypothetical protein ACPG7F_04875 [Aggregatilineales bacterium]
MTDSKTPERPDDRVDIRFKSTRHYRDQLDAAAGGSENRTEFINEALREAAERAGVELPPRSAPNGLRAGVLPDGRQSRLYENRMQIVAFWNGREIEFEHLHQYAGGFRGGVLLSEQHPLASQVNLPAFEMHLSDTLSHWTESKIAQEVAMAIMEDGVLEELEKKVL